MIWPPNGTACATAWSSVGFEVFRPAGTYFVTADIRPLSTGDVDGMAFCRALPHRCGVVAVPNSVFYDDKEAGRHLVRFAFCKRLEVLEEAVARLKALAALSGWAGGATRYPLCHGPRRKTNRSLEARPHPSQEAPYKAPGRRASHRAHHPRSRPLSRPSA